MVFLLKPIRVTGAAYHDGLLDIELVREVPEHKKPRTIAIDGTQPALEAVNDRKAA